MHHTHPASTCKRKSQALVYTGTCGQHVCLPCLAHVVTFVCCHLLVCCVLQPPPSIETALSAAFPEANASLKKRPGLDADLSGSTGIVALVHKSRLVAANLGDSRCVLGA